MKQENSILNLMISHHTLIEIYFTILKDKVSGGEKATEEFDRFKWQLEKHFFVEERVIFDYDHFRIKNEKIYQLVKELTKEHREMLKTLETFTKKIADSENIDISEFRRIHHEHIKTEEMELYPLLDKELNELKKQEIIKKVNDIVLEKG